MDMNKAVHHRAMPAVLALLLALGVLAGCSGDDGASGSGSSNTTTTGPDTDATPDGSEDGDPSAEAPFAVGRRDLVLIDPTRPTDAVEAQGREATTDRTIELSVFYPAGEAAGDGAEVVAEWDHSGEAPVDSVAELDAAPADGPFPLLVFSHGFNGQGSSFVALAEQWAREGYVVALPTFPLSRQGVGILEDYVNQPGDLSFILDRLTAPDPTGEVPPELTDGLVDADRIALGGHSLGAATVFRAVYNDCCSDERAKVTITVAGGPLDAVEGGYDDQPEVPMLLVHGAADPLVDVGVSDAMVDFVRAPVTYLRFDAADHVSMFVAEEGELFSRAVMAYLDAHLRDDPTGLDDLPDLVDASGLAELRKG